MSYHVVVCAGWNEMKYTGTELFDCHELSGISTPFEFKTNGFNIMTTQKSWSPQVRSG